MAALRFNPFTGTLDYVTPSPYVIDAICLSGDLVGQCIYSRGSYTGSALWVATADIYDVGKMPAVGIIISKSSATSCKVRIGGEYTISGGVAGKYYFVGSDGYLTADRPAATLTQYAVVQIMGVALDVTHLLLQPSTALTKVVP